jgi:hypothetical protein
MIGRAMVMGGSGHLRPLDRPGRGLARPWFRQSMGWRDRGLARPLSCLAVVQPGCELKRVWAHHAMDWPGTELSQ